MCGEGFNICCALNRYFDRSGILCEASGKHLGDPWETFGRPFGALERSQSSYIRLSRALMCAPGLPRAPKEAPRAPKEAPRASKRAPRGVQEVSERLQEASKRPPRGSKRPPRGLQGASKGSPVSPMGVQVAFWMSRVDLVSQYALSCDPKRPENSNSCSKDAAGIINGVSI